MKLTSAHSLRCSRSRARCWSKVAAVLSQFDVRVAVIDPQPTMVALLQSTILHEHSWRSQFSQRYRRGRVAALH